MIIGEVFVLVLFLMLLSAHHVLLLLSVELSFVEKLLLDMGVVILCYVFVPANLVDCLLVAFQLFLEG